MKSQIQVLYEDDMMSLAEISQMLHIGKETLRNQLINSGVKLRPRGGPNRHSILDQLVQDGIDVHGIIRECKKDALAAKKLGISLSALKRWIRKERDD